MRFVHLYVSCGDAFLDEKIEPFMVSLGQGVDVTHVNVSLDHEDVVTLLDHIRFVAPRLADRFIAEDRAASDAAMKLAGDIEFDLFQRGHGALHSNRD